MADIFISYSSKDREKADQLSELLASAGLSVWIDKKSLEISTSWSGEIADAIEQCTAFIILLSPNSAVSVNVAKEVSLASHYKKKILPLDLEPVELSRDLAYHLAGLHRAPMTNIDAIIRAIGALGLEATQAPTLKIVKETDGRKSLMILPFDDLSPTADNGWFADGIVSELINALSNVKALKLADAQTTKEFKSFRGHLTTYAREMQIRYFVQGDVRKFGDQIKISARLLDIDTGDHLWQDSIKATMEDIFDVQEAVANKVVEGLKLHLTREEKKKLAERGTENAEAYELYLKAREYFFLQTKEGFEIAAQLSGEAIRLDPGYANAYEHKANALASMYHSYHHDPNVPIEVEQLCKEALRIAPDLARVYYPLTLICLAEGKYTEAEAAAREYIRLAPEDPRSHFALGLFYYHIGEPANAIAPYEESVRLKPDNQAALSNLCSVCYTANETEKCRTWASVALPIQERHLKLHPDDEKSRMNYATLLHFAGRTEEARVEAMRLKQARDSQTLYGIAWLFAVIADKQQAIETFRNAITAGLRNLDLLTEFLTDNITSLAGTSEYEEVKRMVEQIEREAEAEKNG